MGDRIDGEVGRGGFNMRTAFFLARASNAAYEEHDEAIKTLGPRNRITFFSAGQFRGLVCFREQFTVLAFRGTQSVENFLTDADTLFLQESPYPGRVHSGFAKAVAEVWPEIRRILGEPDRSKPLWITGHSLGGAMATLASVRLASEGYPLRAVYTFGSPRVGDQFFRKAYRLPNYRFVNDNDLIPHLPFRWCYKHVGILRFMPEDGGFTEERKTWVAKKRTLAAKAKHVHRAHRKSDGILDDLFDFDWLADHYLAKYLDCIRNLLSGASDEHPDSLDDEARGVSVRMLLADRAVQEVSQVRPRQNVRRTPAEIEADFLTAFGNQPSLKMGGSAESGESSAKRRRSA
jgi:triacylglycerol lipase